MSEPPQGSLPAPGPSRKDEPPSFWRDARAALTLVFRSPLALFIVGGLSFVTTLFWLQGTGLRGLAYLTASRAQFWLMLGALPPTAWVLSLFLLFGDFEHNRSAWPRTRRGRLAAVLSLVPLVFLLALPLLAGYLALREDARVTTVLLSLDPYILRKTLGLSVLGLTPAVLYTSALVGIHLQLLERLPKYQHLGEPLGAESLDEEVLWYQRRQALLRRFLRISSAINGISILGLGATHNVINLVLPSSAEPLPIGPVMSYGLYYTGLLASLYGPASYTLKKVGEALAERLVWQALGAHPTWKQRFEEQQAVRKHLGLRGSALQDIQQGLAVLAPFLASLSSLALGPGG